LHKYKYHFPKKIDINYGCVIFSRYPISKCLKIPFNSNMGRSLIIIKIAYPFHSLHSDGVSVESKEIVISTTHFESIFNRKMENTVKLNQYRTTKNILDRLYELYKCVIFCADANIMDHEEKYFISTDDDKWKDAWKIKGDESNRYTFDNKKNIYLLMKKSPYKSRLDRIIYRGENMQLIKFKLIDKNDIIEPSDHFGILTKFEIV